MAVATLNDSIIVSATSYCTSVGGSDFASGVRSIGDVRGELGVVPSSAEESDGESAEDSSVSLGFLCSC